MQCPCSKRPYAECCEPYITGEQVAPTAESLMRSRFTAHVKGEIDYILDTVHPETRPNHDEGRIREWAQSVRWMDLEILDTEKGGPDDDEGSVEFIARYREKNAIRRHHELATFRKQDDKWYFYDGAAPKVKQIVRQGPKVGRNDPCPCGSEKKFKKCCGKA